MDQRQRLFEAEILRMERRDRALAPEVPQQPLLRDAFRDPRHDPLLQPAEPCNSARVGLAAASTLFRLMKHHREPVANTTDDSARASLRLRSLDGRFAVQFVPVGPDRNHEHVHSRTIAEKSAVSPYWRRRRCGGTEPRFTAMAGLPAASHAPVIIAAIAAMASLSRRSITDRFAAKNDS